MEEIKLIFLHLWKGKYCVQGPGQQKAVTAQLCLVRRCVPACISHLHSTDRRTELSGFQEQFVGYLLFYMLSSL